MYVPDDSHGNLLVPNHSGNTIVQSVKFMVHELIEGINSS